MDETGFPYDWEFSSPPPPPSASPPPRLQNALVGVNPVMTIIGFVISSVFIVCICTRIVCIRILRRNLERQQAIPEDRLELVGRPRQGMDMVTVQSFPTLKYLPSDFGSAEDAQCCVCLCEYDETDVLRRLPPCNHSFHRECIDSWLQQNSTCPVCRTSLLVSSGGAKVEPQGSSTSPSTQDRPPSNTEEPGVQLAETVAVPPNGAVSEEAGIPVVATRHTGATGEGGPQDGRGEGMVVIPLIDDPSDFGGIGGPRESTSHGEPMMSVAIPGRPLAQTVERQQRDEVDWGGNRHRASSEGTATIGSVVGHGSEGGMGGDAGVGEPRLASPRRNTWQQRQSVFSFLRRGEREREGRPNDQPFQSMPPV